MIITVCRKENFNAAHRLHNDAWDEKTNKDFYGLCNNPNYHGHNYDLTIKITGEVNPETGYLIDMKELSDLIKTEVIHPFDHKNLNLDVPEFKKLNPTAEHIAFVIYQKLKPKLPKQLELTVVLYETPRNYVEYNGK